MQTKHKLNHSLFIFGLMILLFSAVCPFVQAQTSSNDIAFWVISNGDTEVYTMKADGSNQTNLSNSTSSFDLLPDWSPDGSRIAFTKGNGIWVMNADGSNKIQLTNPVNNEGDERPSRSPNGSKIAFVRENANGGDIWVMNADGSNQVKLTTSAVDELNTDPRWSPDGTKIVFANVRNVRTSGGTGVFVMNASGSNQVRLTDDGNRPDWSPDGSKIAFVSGRNGNAEIYVMNPDGSNQTRVTNNPALDAAPSWSPDGTKFVFVTNRDGNDEIYTMNADGSNSVRLTNNTASDEGPRWKPSRTAAPRAVYNDFFGTGRSDYLLFDRSNTAIRWDILRNPVTSPPQIRRTFWGLSASDFPAVGDYDGDLKMDVGVWRPGTANNPQSYFYIQRSSDPNPNAIYAQPWGLPTDRPAFGDYDGDGKDDFAVTRNESGKVVWYILPSGGGSFRRVEFGAAAGDFVIPSHGSDFNNDGRDDLIVVRLASNGDLTFYIGDAVTGQVILVQQWGNSRVTNSGTVYLFYGNYLGDSRADVGIYYDTCQSNPNCDVAGTFWFKETGSSNYTVTKFGVPFNSQTGAGDFPMQGDFDGDGKFDITVTRFQNKTFYSLLSSNGQLQAQYFDGNLATPPSGRTNPFEGADEPNGKSVPASLLKGLAITKQSNGTYKWSG